MARGQNRIYNQKDFDRRLVLEQRTIMVAAKVSELLTDIDAEARR